MSFNIMFTSELYVKLNYMSMEENVMVENTSIFANFMNTDEILNITAIYFKCMKYCTKYNTSFFFKIFIAHKIRYRNIIMKYNSYVVTEWLFLKHSKITFLPPSHQKFSQCLS